MENNLQFFTQLPQFAALQLQNILLFVKDNPSAGGLVEPHDGPADGGFAAAAFAHQAHRLSPPNIDADAVHRPHDAYRMLHQPRLDGEMDL